MRQIVFILFLFFIYSCSSNFTNYESPEEIGLKIARQTAKYIEGNPDFFIPETAPQYNYFNIVKNTSGGVAWTSAQKMGSDLSNLSIENIDNYVEKIDNATIENQTTWSQYLKNANCGFPFYHIAKNDIDFINSIPYQAGFCCFSLVYNVLRDAGIIQNDDFIGSDTQEFIQHYQFEEILPSSWNSSIDNGDIVAYDFNSNGSIDHIGIVISISYNDVNDYKVVSSNSTIELHKFGAKTHRVSSYNSVNNGGDFSIWGYPNVSKTFYKTH